MSELVLVRFAYLLNFHFQKKKKKKKKGEKKRRKKKNPLVVNEDLRTNLFSQEEESDAKSRHDF